jgi:hypothetical protein
MTVRVNSNPETSQDDLRVSSDPEASQDDRSWEALDDHCIYFGHAEFISASFRCIIDPETSSG